MAKHKDFDKAYRLLAGDRLTFANSGALYHSAKAISDSGKPTVRNSVLVVKLTEAEREMQRDEEKAIEYLKACNPLLIRLRQMSDFIAIGPEDLAALHGMEKLLDIGWSPSDIVALEQRAGLLPHDVVRIFRFLANSNTRRDAAFIRWLTENQAADQRNGDIRWNLNSREI